MSIFMRSAVGLIAVVALAGACVDKKGTSPQVISTTVTKWFEIHTQEMNWIDAVWFCKERHGNLATIRNQEELDQTVSESLALTNFTGAETPWYYWLGGTDFKSNRGYYWTSDGKPISFKNWYPNYPTAKSGANCLQLYFKYGIWGWINDDCSVKRYPVCEYYKTEDPSLFLHGDTRGVGTPT